LQLAILESQTGPNASPELATLRRHGTRLAGLVKIWQESRKPVKPAVAPVTLNDLVENAIESIRLTRPFLIDGPLDLLLEPDIPPVAGSLVDIQRLCFFLVKNALAKAKASGLQTVVRTTMENHWVVVEICPGLDPGGQLDCNSLVSEGINCLEVASCRRLVHRLQGELESNSEPGEALTLKIKLLPAGS